MEEVKRMRLIRRQLEDVPELIQRIQLALPSKEAARTSILSKSWLHAWSTSPAIRFFPSVDSLKKQHQKQYMSWIRRTLVRYQRDKLPITSLDLQFGIHTAFRSAQKLIMQAAKKKSLNELHLAILTESFTLPDEIFSSENLNTLSLELINRHSWKSHPLYISSNPAIHCTNLRVLELVDVHITEEVLHKLLSTCKLLEKIDIHLPLEMEKIKVNNLRYLHELRIYLNEYNDILEVDDVPSLRSLVYDARYVIWSRPVLFQMGTIGSLRELYLDNVSMDDAFTNMIKSNFPFLESLTLIIKWCNLEIMDIRSLTLRRLRFDFLLKGELDILLNKEIKIQVYAPNLLVYKHASSAMPSLLFTAIPPEHIVLSLELGIPIDESFFLKMREALNLSSKFHIEIIVSSPGVLLPFNIDDVRTMVPFPATNVKEFHFRTLFNEILWENSLLFDAVFFICHPVYVTAYYEVRLQVANYLLKIKGVMENCEIRNPLDGRWVTLTSSSLSLLDITIPLSWYGYQFKLSWCSP